MGFQCNHGHFDLEDGGPGNKYSFLGPVIVLLFVLIIYWQPGMNMITDFIKASGQDIGLTVAVMAILFMMAISGAASFFFIWIITDWLICKVSQFSTHRNRNRDWD